MLPSRNTDHPVWSAIFYKIVNNCKHAYLLHIYNLSCFYDTCVFEVTWLESYGWSSIYKYRAAEFELYIYNTTDVACYMVWSYPIINVIIPVHHVYKNIHE